MALDTITVTNVSSTPLSLDLKFLNGKRFRWLLPLQGTVNLAPYATFEDINQEPQLLALRTATPARITITPASGTTDIANLPLPPNTGNVATKLPCRLVTAIPGDNAHPLSGVGTNVDGTVPVLEDRVLVRSFGGGAHINNGIYIVKAGAWERAADWNQLTEIVTGTHVIVTAGATLGGTAWYVATTGTITPGTTSTSIVQWPPGGASVDPGPDPGLVAAEVPDAANTLGVSALAARADHVHQATCAAPTQGIGASNAEGAAATFARSNHDHTIRTTDGGGADLTVGAIPVSTIITRSAAAVIQGGPLITTIPAFRYTLAVDSNIAGQATEAPHTSIAIAANALGVARRTVRYYARLRVQAAVGGPNNWTFGLRLGENDAALPPTGVLLCASAATAMVVGSLYTFEGQLQVRSYAAPAITFSSVTQFTDVAAAGDVTTGVLVAAGAIADVTAAVPMYCTGIDSAGVVAGDQVTLEDMWVEVWNA